MYVALAATANMRYRPGQAQDFLHTQILTSATMKPDIYTNRQKKNNEKKKIMKSLQIEFLSLYFHFFFNLNMYLPFHEENSVPTYAATKIQHKNNANGYLLLFCKMFSKTSKKNTIAYHLGIKFF